MPYHIMMEWIPVGIRSRLQVLELRMHREDTVQSLNQAFANHMDEEDGVLGQQSEDFQDNWRVRAGDALTLNNWPTVFDDYDTEPDIETFERFILEVIPVVLKHLVKLVLPPVKLGGLAWNIDEDEADAEADVVESAQRRLVRACDRSPLDITLAYVLDTAIFERLTPAFLLHPRLQRGYLWLGNNPVLDPVTGRRTHMTKIAFRSKAEFARANYFPIW
jgi:hypothetical protein